MREAILECRDKLRIGLPYGDGIDEKYLQHGMFAQPAVNGNLRMQDFAYLDVMSTITAYATAECYRLFEARDSERALDLAVAQVYVAW